MTDNLVPGLVRVQEVLELDAVERIVLIHNSQQAGNIRSYYVLDIFVDQVLVDNDMRRLREVTNPQSSVLLSPSDAQLPSRCDVIIWDVIEDKSTKDFGKLGDRFGC